MNHTTRAQRINKRQDAIWERSLKLKRQAELMAFADHIYAASEPNPIGEYLEDEAREWEEDNGGIDLDAEGQ
jgi:hypothetical protein